jgi:uncharacterized protein (DUF1697 family)
VIGRVLELAALAVATRRIVRTVGVARSTLRGAVTPRNWNTVQKFVEMLGDG